VVVAEAVVVMAKAVTNPDSEHWDFWGGGLSAQ
jgi:hypothetical protein